MKDVFDAPIEAPQGEPIPEPAPIEVATEVEEAAPPAAEDTTRQVPLRALEEERAKRREFRDKYHHAQGQLEALRALQTQARPPSSEPAPELDPATAFAQRQETIILNASERMARKTYGEEEVDKAFALVKDNPHLRQAALQQADPWDFVVREGRKLAALAEIGDDPVAYRARIEAEVTAKLAGTPLKPLPASLAGARSSGARTAPGFTGPPDFKDIFK